MSENGIKRQLKAIFSADVKGYSKLMGDDDEATVHTITTYRKIIAACIEKHMGRVVDSPGDNILAEFKSALAAVSSAIEIQKTLKAENYKLPQERQMDFRIGINLGDILHKDDRIYGDGVNVAARIESLADPGGICISRGVFDQVKKKVHQGFEYLGEHKVKNIAEPVRIYRVLLTPEHEGKILGEQIKRKIVIRQVYVAAIAIFLVCSTALLWVYFPRQSEIEPASVDRMPYPLPDRPSVAVLPFDNMSGDPEQEYFCDGITEDLTTDLSKISGLLVIARNSSFTYKNKPVKIQQVAKDLGVNYVLEGSVRKAGDKVRITAQLVDAQTGHHLWAERFDGVFDDIFVLQDKFTRKIVAALSVKLTKNEHEKLSQRFTQNVEAYDAYLKGRDQLYEASRDGLVKAVSHFEEAIELDSSYSNAHAGLAIAYQKSIEMAWHRKLGWSDARSKIQNHLQISMKNPTPYAHYALAKNRLYQRRYEEAVDNAESALAFDPNYPDGYFLMGLVKTFIGRSDEAIDYFTKAMRLDPYNSGAYLYYLGLAQYCLKRYDDAVASLERSLRLNPQYGPWPLAIAYAQLNRGKEAANMLAGYFERRKWQVVFIENTFRYWPFKEQKDLDHWAEGLRKSGLMRPWNPVYRRDYDAALFDAKQLLNANAGDALSQYTMGETLVYSGRSEEAIAYLEKAIRLDSNHPGYYMFTLGVAQFCQAKYKEAATSLETCLYKRKMHVNPPMWLLAATYAYIGREDDAKKVITNYMNKNGFENFTVARVLQYYLHAFKKPEDTERFAQGLNKAGLPRR